jgi:hypothetical protein
LKVENGKLKVESGKWKVENARHQGLSENQSIFHSSRPAIEIQIAFWQAGGDDRF